MAAVVLAANLGPPRQISDDDFDAICDTFRIEASKRAEVREFLDEAVAAFAEVITAGARTRTRKADRQAIERAVVLIRRAQCELTRSPGPAGILGLRLAGRSIAPAISVSWMQHHFPAEDAVPDTIYWPPDDRAGRSPAGTPSRPMDIEDLSRDQRIRFMERRAPEAITALLGDIAGTLDAGRRAIVELPYGRKPLRHRTYLIAAMAELWHRLGRRPTRGITSQFASFCEAVHDAIGWPTDGVNRAAAEGIKLWREHYRP